MNEMVVPHYFTGVDPFEGRQAAEGYVRERYKCPICGESPSRIEWVDITSDPPHSFWGMCAVRTAGLTVRDTRTRMRIGFRPTSPESARRAGP